MPTRNHTEELFLKMMSEYEGVIFRVCLAFTDRSDENVRDLFQEIVYNLWKSFPGYRGDSTGSTWVYRVAFNTAVSQSRRTTAMPSFLTLDDAHLSDLADECRDAVVERLYELIDMLDNKEKELIFMYLDRVPMRRIAAEAGMSELAARQRIRRIKQKLVKLNDHGI